MSARLDWILGQIATMQDREYTHVKVDDLRLLAATIRSGNESSDANQEKPDASASEHSLLTPSAAKSESSAEGSFKRDAELWEHAAKIVGEECAALRSRLVDINALADWRYQEDKLKVKMAPERLKSLLDDITTLTAGFSSTPDESAAARTERETPRPDGRQARPTSQGRSRS